jgi:hypothetical protein
MVENENERESEKDPTDGKPNHEMVDDIHGPSVG